MRLFRPFPDMQRLVEFSMPCRWNVRGSACRKRPPDLVTNSCGRTHISTVLGALACPAGLSRMAFVKFLDLLARVYSRVEIVLEGRGCSTCINLHFRSFDPWINRSFDPLINDFSVLSLATIHLF